MLQWWRNLNRYGPILWIPIAYVGHLGGRAALCFLVLTLLQGPLHIALSRAGQIGYVIAVLLASWVVGGIAESLGVHPIKVTHGDVWIGWFFVVIAGAVYTATALMGR